MYLVRKFNLFNEPTGIRDIIIQLFCEENISADLLNNQMERKTITHLILSSLKFTKHNVTRMITSLWIPHTFYTTDLCRLKFKLRLIDEETAMMEII